MSEELAGCPLNGDTPMPEIPPFPHINCPAGSPISLQFGWIGKLFLVAIVAGFSTTGWLSYAQVTTDDAVEETVERDLVMEKNIKVMDRNMLKIDENQRIQEQQTALTVKQLNKLLELQGVTERITPPKIRPSEMEPIE